ncbi:MAG: 1-(5-phosphoribosyl)-5-[(5-phosphoribosylamino)methylideneamino]imidazole-4-carboxamide isomerase [Spirochaetales bacterium]|nr:1-(5-phosphoribosyl)-5-[(5-phosphoribosylamino)methylideneamino]imidazole-4-carboxamide isomerase [Spirochaetales bacterium]
MLIFPAMDLCSGKVVRLRKGDYDDMTVFSSDPLKVARTIAGVSDRVHIVDLDGARDLGAVHLDVIARIKKETGLFCQVGGGIRSEDMISRYIDSGIDRVILGTAAVTDPKLLDRALERWGEAIAVGVDIRDGFAAIRGWKETSSLKAMGFCRDLHNRGVSNIICTDISRDGMLGGTNRELYRRLSGITGLDITASGGVSGIEDIRELKALGLYGAIIGRAWYERRIDLAEAIREAL